MANALLAWDNQLYDPHTWVDGWAPFNATAANLSTPSLAERWVALATDTTKTRIEVQLTGARSVELVGLAGHNMLASSPSFTVTASNDNFASTVYSGTTNVWPSGSNQSRAGLRWTTWLALPTPVVAQQWRIQINDTANAEGFVKVSRLLIMRRAWRPTVNILTGSSIGWEGGPQPVEALSGAEWFVEREAFRVARLRLANMPTDEMMAGAFDLQRVAAGSRRDVLFVWDPADTEHIARRTIYGRLRAMSPLEEPNAGTLSGAFEVKELL